MVRRASNSASQPGEQHACCGGLEDHGVAARLEIARRLTGQTLLDRGARDARAVEPAHHGRFAAGPARGGAVRAAHRQRVRGARAGVKREQALGVGHRARRLDGVDVAGGDHRGLAGAVERRRRRSGPRVAVVRHARNTLRLRHRDVLLRTQLPHVLGVLGGELGQRLGAPHRLFECGVVETIGGDGRQSLPEHAGDAHAGVVGGARAGDAIDGVAGEPARRVVDRDPRRFGAREREHARAELP
jgi:hypothetical protein